MILRVIPSYIVLTTYFLTSSSGVFANGTPFEDIIGANKVHSPHASITPNPEEYPTGKGEKVIVIESRFNPGHDAYLSNLTESTIDHFKVPTDGKFDSHGSHVTSTLTKVAPKAAIRVIDYGGEAYVPAFTSKNSQVYSIAKALQIAAQDEKAKIVNLSLSLTPQTRYMPAIPSLTREAMIKVARSGKLIVMAAGNQHVPLGKDDYTRSLVSLANDPEMLGRLILVGATKCDIWGERLADFSDSASQAKEHFISAPGVKIVGANAFNGETILNGTSMAAPQVSAALALLMEAQPGLKLEEYKEALLKSARQESLNNSYIFPPKPMVMVS
ncbi:MAG: Peptidase S8 and S53 subtilisin kexin sedolisin [uncultured bacterium]|nr:MAG: Peptidase S8 and S53 subtilisin kexin sedolisin [uncultured bacterium]OFW68938.1 MAG: hypothetical protein A2X70_06900 [Alphaproteobacteria bacterium GWC2_42_16]OFW73772.1 MAG: hypothetical protein A2Z80_03125 [Alphaproteobacteria bacterium GWA2_41_27]OFW82033.1 MAG: hypothetical protein A3E50_01390 [Alphaproteobacteria bacterium RIFCSPHIGHO2_12_FULL_42_100]OFW85791.1 MAG: hypothetical protein A2W06_02770 [Alphaproteobacteria bacterium RBG_16_42_14]OFW91177.1 MAG: hypothetical protein 